jgi:hypothetical protein
LSSDAQYNVRETEQTIDAVAGVVTDLKGMALQMSDTLDRQLIQIDQLQASAANANVNLKKTRGKVKREFD